MTKKEYLIKLDRLNKEVEEFIKNASIYGDGKDELRYQWIKFRSTAETQWRYSHPNGND